jgi:hypothetical protein
VILRSRRLTFCENADVEVGIRQLYLLPPCNEPEDNGTFESQKIQKISLSPPQASSDKKPDDFSNLLAFFEIFVLN